MQSNEKFEAAFRIFEPAPGLEEIKSRIGKILEEQLSQAQTVDVLKFLYSTIDLTTLRANDTRSYVEQFVGAVNERRKKYGSDFPTVAAICVYPQWVSTVKRVLEVEGVRVAAVSGGFPASQTLLDAKITETALTLIEGADEIDIVLNLGAFLDGDYDSVKEEIEEQQAHCEKHKAHLKVILETGLLEQPDQIQKAAAISLFSGADFLKTSTGKEYPGASPEAAYMLCSVIRQYHAHCGRKVGVKFSGGIRTVEQALQYYCIVKDILGEEWLTPELFRIGASSLETSLREAILA